MRAIGIVTSFAFVLIFSAIFDGYVLSVMWGWFIVPAFHTPQITIPLAIGISMVIGMLINRPASNRDKEKDKSEGIGESILVAFLVALVVPVITLGLGAIVHAFV